MMKKALDQTVRDLKREVNKKVLKVPSIEQKTLDATSNEPWGPHGSHLADIAQASHNYHDYQLIMTVLWRRIQDTGKNWRHVYKALNVLDYLIIHGSERVIDEIREHAYQISTLSDFMYIDSNGSDQGSNVRRKSQILVALVTNKGRLLEVRHKSLSNRDKNHNISNSGASRPPLYSSSHYKDEHVDSRDGDREDGHVQERDLAFRDRDIYRSGGDDSTLNRHQDVSDINEPYYRDDNSRVGASTEYQYRPRSQSVDGYIVNSFDDYDRHSTRSGGSRDDEILHGQRIDAPPSYDEAINDSWSLVQNDKGAKTTSVQEASLTSRSIESSSGSTIQAADASKSAHAREKDINFFDEHDCQKPVSAASTEPSNDTELDIFGVPAVDFTDSSNSLFVTSTYPSEDIFAIYGQGANFVKASTACAVPSEPDKNLFGDAPFKAIPQQDFQSEPHASVSFAPGVVDGQLSMATPDFYSSEYPVAHSSKDILDGILPWTGVLDSVSFQETQFVAPPQRGFSANADFYALQNSLDTGSADPPIGQLNPFEQPDLMNHLAKHANPFTCQAFLPAPRSEMNANQLNSLDKPALLEPQTSQEVPVFCNTLQSRNPNIVETYFPLSTQASNPASSDGNQATYMNFTDKLGLSSLNMSQATSVHLHANIPFTDPANYSGFQMNPSQQLNLSPPPPSQTVSVSTQAFSPSTEIDSSVARINILNPPGPFQTVHSTALANGHEAQMNPSQAFLVDALPNQQSAHLLNPSKQPLMSASQPSLEVSVSSQPFQSSAPANIQASQINPSLPHGFSNPLTSEMTVELDPLLLGISAPMASQNIQVSLQTTTSNMQTIQFSFTPQPGLPDLMVSSQVPAKPQASKKNFEPKSTVWADTINRGLVNLNLSGSKNNSLVDIGIDFDDMNRKEKRKEVKSSQTPSASAIGMGKAMGAGSGLGRAGSSALALPLIPTLGSNMGMGFGRNMNQPNFGMGMREDMRMNIGAEITMGQLCPTSGMPQLGPGIRGSYIPMNAGGNLGQQQPYGGGGGGAGGGYM